MASLTDVANAPKTVPVNGLDVRVYGISFQGVALLMQRFPDIAKLLSGVKIEMTAQDLMKIAPQAMGAVIAAGCGEADDPDAEETASKLGVGPQLDLVDMIIRLTFPTGVRPFVQKLQDLGLFVQVEDQDQQAPGSQEQ